MTAYSTVDYKPPVLSNSILGLLPFYINTCADPFKHRWPGLEFGCHIPEINVEYYQGQLALDLDGSKFGKANVDGTSVKATALRHFPNDPTDNGKPRYVDSYTVPYFSMKKSFWTATGAKLGDFAAIIYGSVRTYAILADVGGKNVGEGSIELHRQLGVDRVNNRGSAHETVTNRGINGSVITVVFKGSRDGLYPTNESVQAKGAALWSELQNTRLKMLIQNAIVSAQAPMPSSSWAPSS